MSWLRKTPKNERDAQFHALADHAQLAGGLLIRVTNDLRKLKRLEEGAWRIGSGHCERTFKNRALADKFASGALDGGGCQWIRDLASQGRTLVSD